MACGHTMHGECFHTYKEVSGIPSIADLPCPSCKQTENDMARRESQLLGATVLAAAPEVAASGSAAAEAQVQQ